MNILTTFINNRNWLEILKYDPQEHGMGYLMTLC